MYMNVLGEYGEPAAESEAASVRGGVNISPVVLSGEGRQF